MIPLLLAATIVALSLTCTARAYDRKPRCWQNGGPGYADRHGDC